MDTLSDEVLEKIFACIDDEKTLNACRRVDRRWNQVAVRQWRRIHSPVSILTESMMKEFLTDMDFRLQDFPFSKFRFINLNPENLLATKQILETHANYIRNLDFQELDDMIHEHELLDFLKHLNILPNLEELRVGSMMRESEITDAINLTLPNLRCLRLPTTLPSHPIAKILLNAAPNLEELETIVLVTTPELQWPLPEERKAIRTIDINLRVRAVCDPATTAVATLLRYLDEWRNVRVKSLTIALHTEDRHQNLVPELRRNIQMVLDTHADHIKIFKFCNWPSSLQTRLTLPVMPQLEKLELSGCGGIQKLAPILGNPFANLKSVSLRLIEPTNILRGAVLGTVEEFKLSFGVADCGVEEFTHWENVFPNLKSFRLDPAWYADVLMYLEFIVSHMRMDSLETLEYRLGYRYSNLSAADQEKVRVKINRIFSGLDNLEEIMERWNSGEKGEEADAEDFWAAIESQRGPCLVNMSGLKSFYLDYPIDDEFATAVLLRMKPLDLITICAKKLSLRVFCQVIARHGSYCSAESLAVA